MRPQSWGCQMCPPGCFDMTVSCYSVQSYAGLPHVMVFITSRCLRLCAGYIQGLNSPASTLDTAFWDPVRGSIMDSRQCLDSYPGFPGVSLSCQIVSLQSMVP